MKHAVHFGAGNIGRGFIAPVLQDNDCEVIFVDVNTDIVNQINEQGQYTIKSLDINGFNKQKIKNIRAVHLEDTQKLNEVLLSADIVTTSVGPKFVEGIFEKVAMLDHKEEQVFIAFENMYRASSNTGSKIKSPNPNLKIIDAVVDKIVPPQPLMSLDVVVETYGSIILDDATELQPLDSSKIVSYKNYENDLLPLKGRSKNLKQSIHSSILQLHIQLPRSFHDYLKFYMKFHISFYKAMLLK